MMGFSRWLMPAVVAALVSTGFYTLALARP